MGSKKTRNIHKIRQKLPTLKEKWIEVKRKSRAGVKYTKYKRVIVGLSK